MRCTETGMWELGQTCCRLQIAEVSSDPRGGSFGRMFMCLRTPGASAAKAVVKSECLSQRWTAAPPKVRQLQW